MHGTEYTARIKALITAKEAAEENMKRVLFQFRNGRKPNPADIADARNHWAEALEVVDPQSDQAKKDAALAVVIRAAESWRNELTTYIIPADESHGEALAETAEGHRTEADDIDDAIKVLTGDQDPEEAANDTELRRDLADQLEELKEEIASEDNSDYDELMAARNALDTALALLGMKGIDS